MGVRCAGMRERGWWPAAGAAPSPCGRPASRPQPWPAAGGWLLCAIDRVAGALLSAMQQWHLCMPARKRMAFQTSRSLRPACRTPKQSQTGSRRPPAPGPQAPQAAPPPAAPGAALDCPRCAAAGGRRRGTAAAFLFANVADTLLLACLLVCVGHGLAEKRSPKACGCKPRCPSGAVSRAGGRPRGARTSRAA